MSLFREQLRRDRKHLRWRWPVLHVSWKLWGALTAWETLKGLLLAGWWLLTHPRTAAALTAACGVGWALTVYGWPTVVAGGHAAAAVAGLWARLHPATFRRTVVWPVKGRWRRFRTYRRLWNPAMRTAGLALPDEQGGALPELKRVTYRPGLDRVRVRMAHGQVLEDWTRVADRLATTFDVLDVRPRTVPARRSGRPRRRLLDLDCLTADPLDRPVPRRPAGLDLTALPVAEREDGSTFPLALFHPDRGATHVLIAGATGSGKGSVAWSVMDHLEPSIRAGLVRVWGLDPKGGMELRPGAGLFTRLETGRPAAMAGLLEQAVAGMDHRQADLARRELRVLPPSQAEPITVLLIDELAALVSPDYVTDAAVRSRIVAALVLLLTQGRATGLSVIAAVQDPRKQTLSFRDLFPLRIALRTTEPIADLILGEGARNRGARTERIPAALPGIGYVLEDGHLQPTRVRFPYLSDTDLRALAAPPPVEQAA